MHKQTQHIILFDGQCKLCNASVNFVLKQDKKGMFRFVPLQSETAKTLLKGQNILISPNTLILLKGKKILSKSTAILHIFKHLNKGYPLLFVFIIIPRFVRDFIYSLIAKNRYRLGGKQDECRIPMKNEKNHSLSH